MTSEENLKPSTSSHSSDAEGRDSFVETAEEEQSEKTDGAIPSVENISDEMFSDDVNKQLESIQRTNSVLSMEKNELLETFINDLITSNIVQKLVDFLSLPALQFDAALALTYLASRNTAHTKAVVDAGAVPHLVTLLTSESPNLCDQAVWALGNIAGHGPTMRDLIIGSGAVEPLLTLAR